MVKNQRGDTIVEVLLSMSIIGLVLGSAFGIANRSIRLGQEAQERTEALKIAETQLEILRNEFKIDATLKDRTDAFCFDTSSTIQSADNAVCTNQNGTGGEGFYNIRIIPTPPVAPATQVGPYTIQVEWQQLGERDQGELNNVRLYYRPGTL